MFKYLGFMQNNRPLPTDPTDIHHQYKWIDDLIGLIDKIPFVNRAFVTVAVIVLFTTASVVSGFITLSNKLNILTLIAFILFSIIAILALIFSFFVSRRDQQQVFVDPDETLSTMPGKGETIEALSSSFQDREEPTETRLNYIHDQGGPTGAHSNSMADFLSACKEYDQAVFFNAKVNFSTWFEPHMQIHLALQDSASTYRQLTTLFNYIRINYGIKTFLDIPDYFATPSSRVLFITDTRSEIVEKIRNNIKIRSLLRSLVYIHIMMSSPLAIITLDQFLNIITKNINIFQNDKDEGGNTICSIIDTLGLPDLTEASSLDNLSYNIKNQLNKMLNDMNVNRGSIRPSIDFAMLLKDTNSKNDECKHPDVWGGAFLDKNELAYCPIDDNMGKKKTTLVGTSPLNVELGDNCRKKLKQFGNVIVEEVFTDMYPYSKKIIFQTAQRKELREIELLVDLLSPVENLFDEQQRIEKKRIRYPKDIYCPLKLLCKGGEHFFDR